MDFISLDPSYDVTRFNALQHGILSRHAVLPWEDRNEYQALLDALVTEHAPQGPTEGHLVEELAGIIWCRWRSESASIRRFSTLTAQQATPGCERHFGDLMG